MNLHFELFGELKDFQLSSQAWSLFQSSDSTLPNFHSFAMTLLKEIKPQPFLQSSFKSLYQILTVWTCKSLKSSNDYTKDFLKLFQILIKKDIFYQVYFQELSSDLFKSLKSLVFGEKDINKFEEIFEIFKTLALSADKLIYMENKEKFKEELENITNELFKWVYSFHNEKIDQTFLSMLRKLVLRERSNIFSTLILSKQCVILLVGIIKEYFFEYFLFIDLTEDCEEEKIFELYYFLIEGYKELDHLILEEIVSSLLNNDSNFIILIKIFDRLMECASNKAIQESFIYRKKIIKLVLNHKIEIDLVLKIYKRLSKLDWSSSEISPELKTEIKIIIFSSLYITDHVFFIEIIIPWLNEEFSVMDLKYFTRICNKSPALLKDFLACLLEVVKSSKDLKNYFKISKEDFIKLTVKYKIKTTKQVSIWTKFQPDSLNEEFTLFELFFNKFTYITIQFHQKFCNIEMLKKNKSISLVHAEVNINTKKWNLFGINFHLDSKSLGRWKLVIFINEFTLEVWISEIGNLKKLNHIKASGSGKILFLSLYKTCLGSEYFLKNSKKVEEEKKSQEIFQFSSDSKILGKKITCDCRALKVQAVNIFDIFLQIGGINTLLPILRKVEDFQVFNIFFKILTEFSEYSLFEKLFDDRTFLILEQIMAEKCFVINLDWLEMCESFFLALKSQKIYQEALECLYLSPNIWSKLLDQSLYYYLEVVKNRIKSYKRELSIEYVSTITNFFIQLSFKVARDSEETVYYYFFQVIHMFFKNMKPDQRLERLILISKYIEKEKSKQLIEQFSKFVFEVKSQKWVVRESDLDQLFYILVSFYKSSYIELCVNFLQLFMRFARKCYTKIMNNRPQQTRLEFIIKTIRQLVNFTKPFLNYSICEVFCEFVNSQKVINTNLKIFIVLVLDSFNRTFIKGHLDGILNVITWYCQESSEFSKVLSSHESFPGVLIDTIIAGQKPTFKISEFIIVLFSHLNNYKNFDLLRIILSHLAHTRNEELIIVVLKGILQKSFASIDYNQNLLLYFFEYLNVLEDIVSKIQYNEIPQIEYISLITDTIRILKDIEYSVSFPNCIGLNGYIFTEKKTGSTSNDCIVLREGGISRQILPLIFLALSFGPNEEIELFLHTFIREDVEVDRIEWKNFQEFPNILFSSLFPRPKKPIPPSLLFIYIYIEWSEIVKSYENNSIWTTNFSSSLSNLFQFIQITNIPLVIQQEAKSILTKQGYLEYKKILDQNWNQIDSLCQSNSIVSLRNLYESQTSSKPSDGNKDSKHISLLSKILGYSVQIESCKNENDLKETLCNSSGNCKTVIFLIILTSLKAKLISQHYTSSEPDYNNRPLAIEIQPLEPLKLDKDIISDGLRFLNDFKGVEADHLEFCGIFKETLGEVTLKNVFDGQGRMIYTKLKEKIDFFSVDSSNYNQDISELEDIIGNSISAIKLDESTILNQSSYTALNDLQDVLISSYQNNENEFECEIITVKGSLYGKLQLYKDFLVFISKNTKKPEFPIISNENEAKVLYSFSVPEIQILKNKTKIWAVSSIDFYMFRKFVQNITSIEIFFKNFKSVFINFFSSPRLLKAIFKIKEKYSQHFQHFDLKNIQKISQDWAQRKISNFEYLLILNRAAGRSFHDLNQYPVFPWVLADFKSEDLDLNNAKIFRDFSLPAGAQTQELIEQKKARFEENRLNYGSGYHFGIHYSSSGVVLDYLVRLQPFTNESKKLHSGQLDLPDRVFWSMKKMWQSLTEGPSSSRELIPELFFLPEILVNLNKEEFGKTQNGVVVENVKLPKWAKGSPFLFVSKHRKALESDYVSKNLNNWVDLIFGYKQKNEAAKSSFNLFHPITYTENYQKIILESPELLLKSYYYQAYHFGQTPFQLFLSPSIKRDPSITTKSIFEKLIECPSSDSIKKYSSPKPFIILVTSVFFIVLTQSSKLYMKKIKLSSLFNIDISSKKDIEFIGVSSASNLIAGILNDNFIVTAGYQDHSIAVHNLKGYLQKTFRFHTMKINEILTGKWLVSASSDSSLISWEFNNDWNTEYSRYYGHLSGIISVSGVYETCVLVSYSQYVLIHHSKTRHVLQKIEEKCEKIQISSLNLIFLLMQGAIKIVYLNGQTFTAFLHNRFKSFFSFDEYLILEQDDCLNIINVLDKSKSKSINLKENLDVMQVVYSKINSILQFDLEYKKEVLFVVNSSQLNSLYSIEASSKLEFNY